jgi:Glyoxalase-like domain
VGRGARLGGDPPPPPDEAAVEPPGPDGLGLPLVFVPVPDPKTGPNRVHLDLASASPAGQAAQVERLLADAVRNA